MRARFPLKTFDVWDLVIVGGSMFGPVFGPQLLDGWAINRVSLFPVLGVASWVPHGSLVKLVTNRLTLLVHAMLPWFRVRLAPPGDVGVLQRQPQRVEAGQSDPEADGGVKRDQRIVILQEVDAKMPKVQHDDLDLWIVSVRSICGNQFN